MNLEREVAATSLELTKSFLAPHIMKKSLILAIMSFFAIGGYANAEIHTWVDKEGTVHFSDTASPNKADNSKVINVQNTNVLESELNTNYSSSSSYSSEQQVAPKPEISIIQPTEQLIRDNSGNVNIVCSVSGANGLVVSTLYIDGSEQQTITGSGTLSVSLTNVDRGEHTIRVISSSNGKEIASSEKSFTLLRAHK